jgi:hypothetical protein
MSWEKAHTRLQKEITLEQKKRFAMAHKAQPTTQFDRVEQGYPKGVKKHEYLHFESWRAQQEEKKMAARRKKISKFKKTTPIHKRVVAAVTGKHPMYEEAKEAKHEKMEKSIGKARISQLEAVQIFRKLGCKKPINMDEFRRGLEVEQEHGPKLGSTTNVTKDALLATGRIALAHLKEIPDYYTRLDKMEKEAEKGGGKKKSLKEWEDPLEILHNENRARILKGAKQGKFWLLTTEDIDRVIEDLITETTTSGAIGGYNKPMGGGDFSQDDPALGGRNKFTLKQLRFAVARLLGRKSDGPAAV